MGTIRRADAVYLQDLKEDFFEKNGKLYLPTLRQSGDKIPYVIEYYRKTYVYIQCKNCGSLRFKNFGAKDKVPEVIQKCRKCAFLYDKDKKAAKLQKFKQTCLERYGSNNIFSSDYGKNLIKEANLKKYGVEYSWQAAEVKNKIKQTCLKKYGTEAAMQSDTVKSKVKLAFEKKTKDEKDNIKKRRQNTCIERYKNASFLQSADYKKWQKEAGITNTSQLASFKKTRLMNVLRKKDLSKYGLTGLLETNEPLVRCNICGQTFLIKHTKDGSIDYNCYNCNPYGYNSSESEQERLVRSWLLHNHINFKMHDRTIIRPKELDFYLEDFDTAIEVDGIYYHSLRSTYNIKEKTELCKSRNVRCLHIYDKDLDTKSNIVFSILNRKLLAKAEVKDDVNIQSISLDLAKDFISKNGLYEFTLADKYFGIYNNNVLSYVFSVVEAYNDVYIKQNVPLIDDTTSYFISCFDFIKTLYSNKIIHTYANTSLFSGNTYKLCGFKLDRLLPEEKLQYRQHTLYGCNIAEFIYKPLNDDTTVAEINQIDDCEQVCIGITGTEHLYITDNEVPTHNCVLDSSPNTMESVIDKYIVDDAPKDPQNLVISGSRWKWFPEEFPKFVVNGKEQHNFDVGFPLYKGTNGEPPRVIESETDLSTFANQDVIWCPKEQSTDLGSVSYIGKAKSEPIEFLRDLAGIPAGSANRIFYDPHVVDDIFDNDLPAVYAPIQAKSTDNPEKLIWSQVKSDLFNWQIDHYQLKYKPQLPRVASVDLAISGDAASICLAHSELKDNNGELLPCYVADALIEVVPVGGQINLDAFSCFIEDLISEGNMKIKYVSYDQFQSRPFEQRLKRLGIVTEYVSVDKNNEPYSNLIDYAWNRRIFAGKNVMLKNNLFSLHLTKRKSGTMKYDHFNGENTYQDDWCLPKSKYTKESWQNSQVGAYAKDAADSLAASVYLLMTHQSDMQGSSVWNPYHLSQQDAMKNLNDILKTTGFSL